VELAVALVVAVVLTPVAASVARRTGVVDLPGPLKTHAAPIPYLGGFAVFGGVVVGVVAAGRVSLLVPLVLALALGTVDDARGLAPRTRLAAEVVVAVAGGAVVPGAWWEQVATGVLVIVLLNAVNLLDGQDGLAAAVAAVSALAFATLGGEAAQFGLALAGALIGFLAFNRPPARIFLGDGGAYLVGTALALAPSLAGEARDPWSVWLAVPLVVAVPLADTAIAVVRRARCGGALFAGDRSHVYDQLVDGHWTVLGSTVVCALAQAVLAAGGVLVSRRTPAVAAAGLAVGVVAVAAVAVTGGFLGPARSAPE
jgi:UDP-GlcNAc:undecaprenyl-phosphate GlcNAc-1-phosphate transferase